MFLHLKHQQKVIPIIAPKEPLECEQYKEKKYCSVAYGFADVNLIVDFEKYVEASLEEKVLIVNNVVDSVNAIKTIKKTFDIIIALCYYI